MLMYDRYGQRLETEELFPPPSSLSFPRLEKFPRTKNSKISENRKIRQRRGRGLWFAPELPQSIVFGRFLSFWQDICKKEIYA